MPIPQTTCSICNATVNKSQTFHIGGGKRACKCHEGVEQKAQVAQNNSKVDAMAKANARKRDWQKFQTNMTPAESEDRQINLELWAWCKCWNCGGVGLPLHDFYMALAKASKTNENIDFANLPKQLIDLAGLSQMLPLKRFVLPSDPRTLNGMMHNIAKLQGWQMAEVVKMLGQMQLCPHCAEGYHIQFMEPLPPLNADILFRLAAVLSVNE